MINLSTQYGAVLLTLALAGACNPAPRENGRQEPTECDLRAFNYLVYSDLEVAVESGDLSGLEIELVRDPLQIWRAIATFAAGEMGAPIRLTELEFDPEDGTLSFSIPASHGDPVFFSGSISCDWVVGEADVYRASPVVEWRLKRVDLCAKPQ